MHIVVLVDCSEEVIKSIWLRLQRQPQLLDNFEMLLRRLTSQLQRSHVDYYELQKTFRSYAPHFLTRLVLKPPFLLKVFLSIAIYAVLRFISWNLTA